MKDIVDIINMYASTKPDAHPFLCLDGLREGICSSMKAEAQLAQTLVERLSH